MENPLLDRKSQMDFGLLSPFSEFILSKLIKMDLFLLL